MGIGLWLSANSARELIEREGVDAFRAWLDERGLVTHTMNGFPFGDFHRKRVKHDVYLPTWNDEQRFDYTIRVADILCSLAPAGGECTISTLPLAWGKPGLTDSQLTDAADRLRRLAHRLAQIEDETGRCVSLCIEPEPGCVIGDSKDLVGFFEQFLLREAKEEEVRRHIRICHDVCHAVVMCESQCEVLQRYHAAGLKIGKVQISSAVTVDFSEIDMADRRAAVEQLQGFAEDRYLHQTTVQTDDQRPVFYEDLPLALAKIDAPEQERGVWRIHFHVPVFLDRFGWLSGSQSDIVACVRRCREFSDVSHFEVETYAWNVLPEELRGGHLADGIAREMRWFSDLATQHLGL